MNDIVEGPGESCLPDQIAVDLPYRQLVIDFLNEVDADSARPVEGLDGSDDTLGLGLISLAAPTRTADKIMGRWGDRIPLTPRPGGNPAKLSEIEKILDGIRAGIGESNKGQYPEVGKVREANVGGLPHIGSGWEYPIKLDASEKTEELLSVRPVLGEPIVIGMIDSPVAPHPKLDDRWTDPTEEPLAWQKFDLYPWLRGHGTFVAGRILSRAPGASLQARAVLDGDHPKSTVWKVAKAMAAAADAGIKVLNLSLGCFTEDGEPPFILARAVQVLTDRGVAVIAAAGNHGEGLSDHAPNAPIFPAACPGAIAVGAFVDEIKCEPAKFSPQAPWVALGAPAFQVESTYLTGEVLITQLKNLPEPDPAQAEFLGYAKWSGTSFATATVSGEIARRMAENGGDVKKAVAELLAMNPADNDGIGRY